MDLKHTKGEWEPVVMRYEEEPKRIVTGVSATLSEDLGMYKYVQVICDMILPDTDEQYIKEHNEIAANAKLISAAPDLLDALNKMIVELKRNSGLDLSDIEYILTRTGAKQAIKKATS